MTHTRSLPYSFHIHRPETSGPHERSITARYRRVDFHPRRLVDEKERLLLPSVVVRVDSTLHDERRQELQRAIQGCYVYEGP